MEARALHPLARRARVPTGGPTGSRPEHYIRRRGAIAAAAASLPMNGVSAM
jgi:hypothetical protein